MQTNATETFEAPAGLMNALAEYLVQTVPAVNLFVGLQQVRLVEPAPSDEADTRPESAEPA